MKQIVVLVREAKPGEQIPMDSHSVLEATMSALDRCRDLGYTAAECLVVDHADRVLEHQSLNLAEGVLATREERPGQRVLVRSW